VSHVEPERGGGRDPVGLGGPWPAERAVAVDEALLRRCRACLHRFATRYAEAPHARHSAKEARLLVEAIDERLAGR
jgi:hypothetical protein